MALEGDLRFNLVKCLARHWMTSTGCSHEDEGSNQAACSCGWVGDRLPNVGAAVEQWASHAVEQTRPILAEAMEDAG